MTGPVSQVIEQEIRGEVRRQGTVVWLDKDASFTRFVDELAARHAEGEVSFSVVGFRGSFLELLFQLEPFGSGLDRQPLLIHMPGFNEESIRKTPLLELYEIGVRFRKSLDTLIREAATARVTPAEIEQFLAKQPSLDEADAWLTTSVSESTFELPALTPDDLGEIDTFREAEHRVLKDAVEALHQRDWPKARAWLKERQGEKALWLQRDELRFCRWAWALVGEAENLGSTLARYPEPLAGARSLEQAVERYAAGAWEVDRAHRTFEQTRLERLEPHLPHYGALREVATELRSTHREWADRLTRGFAAACQEHGFLPPADLQQRTLFEQVVLPLTRGGEKVALFLIDAFRYEMATGLRKDLAKNGAVVDLKPRLAELPTITAVGMNALAPVAVNGRLAVAGILQGFKTGEFTVRGPEDRARAMGLRTGGKPALLLKLAEAGEKSPADLTRILKSHPLVVVHSKEIDAAGEANVGLPTFESTLRQVKAAWHHLQLAGIKNAVFTADHGFLLQDETTRSRPFGKKTDPQRRYVLDDYPRAEEGMVPVSLSSLQYDGLPGYLLFRDDTAVFSTGKPGISFVHGGLSPQERVIPVLTITRKRPEQAVHAEYALQVEPLFDVMGHHRLKLRVVHAPGTLEFAVAGLLDIALRVPGRDDVHVIVKDAAGPATLRAGRLNLPVGEEWTELFFDLEGPADERVRIEIYHPETLADVRSVTPEPWYSVSGTASGDAKERDLPPLAAWADAIADEGARKVFIHIEKHRAITEPEVTNLLGSPRAFRRFSLEFDQYLAKLPFRVRIESGEGGKRYVREDNR